MRRFSDPLSKVKVASPCMADWDTMVGNDRVRFCGHCQLNVFNLSAMTRAEAERLIAGSEQRLCVRFYRRRDGSILTQDCPVGLRALRRRISRVRNAVAATLFGFFTGLGGTIAFRGWERMLEDSMLNLHAEITMGSMTAEPVKKPMLEPPDTVTVGKMEWRGKPIRRRSFRQRPSSGD